jgi:hypothetical protein
MEGTAISVRVHGLHKELVCSTLADTDAAGTARLLMEGGGRLAIEIETDGVFMRTPTMSDPECPEDSR